jgi:hypothetical protein
MYCPPVRVSGAIVLRTGSFVVGLLQSLPIRLFGKRRPRVSSFIAGRPPGFVFLWTKYLQDVIKIMAFQGKN